MKYAIGCLMSATAGALFLLSAAAVSQSPFPDEPGRDTLLLACSQCHSAGKMLSVELSAEEWEYIVYDMLARGANIHADEVDTVLAYVKKNFAADAEGED